MWQMSGKVVVVVQSARVEGNVMMMTGRGVKSWAVKASIFCRLFRAVLIGTRAESVAEQPSNGAS